MNTRWQLLQYLFRSSCYVSVFCVFGIYKAIYLFSGQDVPLIKATSPWSLFPVRCGMSRIPLLNCSFVWICNVEIPRFLQRLEAHSHGDLIECICLQPKLIDSDTLRGPWGPRFDMTVSAGLTQDISDDWKFPAPSDMRCMWHHCRISTEAHAFCSRGACCYTLKIKGGFHSYALKEPFSDCFLTIFYLTF